MRPSNRDPRGGWSWTTLVWGGWLLGVSVPMLAGQALAFGRGFTVGRTLALSLAVLPVLAWAYAREGPPWPRPPGLASRALRAALLALAGLLWALVVVPVALWPRSPLGAFSQGVPTWDVLYYHLPKAADVVQRGHFWNLALPYGQYPPGWEMLLALSVGIGHSAEGLGPAAGVALVGLLVSFHGLLQRETRWPAAVTAVLVGGMMFSFYLPVPNNPWRELGRVVHYASGVGKNDVLAAALLLSVLGHGPFGVHPSGRRVHRVGLGLSLAAALAVKPQVGLWAGGLTVAAGATRRVGPRVWAAWAAGGVLGSLWLVRNVALLGRPFSPVAAVLQRRSLAYHLADPRLWHSWPKTLLLAGALTLFLAGWAWRRPSWRGAVLVAAGLLLGFTFTPASVQPHGERLRVAWRLGLAALVWLWVLAWAWLAHGGLRPRRPPSRRAALGLTAVALALTVALATRYGWRLRVEPAYGHGLYDPFPQPVGTGGYWSVFAYLHRCLPAAAVDFDGAPPWYVYGPDLARRPVRPGHYPGGQADAVPQPAADYWLVCAAAWRPYGRVEDPAAVAEQVRRWQAAGHQVLYADPACALARATASPTDGAVLCEPVVSPMP